MPELIEPTTPVAPVPAGASGEGGGTQTPDGFVLKADFDALEAQRRQWQATADRLTQQIESVPAPVTVPAPSPASPSFDPAEFEQRILAGVQRSTDLRIAAEAAQREFPHADPALFEAERLGQFGSVASLRLAAEVSHVRVQGVIDARVAETEAKLRQETGAAVGGASSPPAGSQGLPGDPSIQELQAMDSRTFNALDPELVARVLRSAGN